MDSIFLISVALCMAAGSVTNVSAADNAVQMVQQKGSNVQGTVVDQNGEPVIGASIKVKGTKVATITDIDGKFVLHNVSGSIEVSYIGYKTQTVRAGKGGNLTVKLEEDANVLNDVVVVGYGQQKKASLTSAITQIKGDEVFKDRSVLLRL